MATVKLLSFAAVAVAVAAFLLGCTNLAMASSHEQLPDAAAGIIHVGGKVLCQDCSKSYKEWINGSQPLKGVKVSLTCMDDRSRVMCYKSDVTDGRGQFEMTLSKIINGGKLLKLKYCLVRLVSSSHPVCNIATDFADGKTGVKLMRPPTYVYNDFVKYRVGPFYYTTPMCEKPDTSPSVENKPNNY